jgi:hypothetical protein
MTRMTRRDNRCNKKLENVLNKEQGLDQDANPPAKKKKKKKKKNEEKKNDEDKQEEEDSASSVKEI